MADNIMLNVKPDFDMEAFAQRMAETYRMKGYTVTVANMNGNCMITFEKGMDGFNKLMGLGESVKINVMKNGEMLSVTFTDAEWTSKIIAGVVGWFLCWIPFITALVGVYRQTSLTKSISNDVTMTIASM